ncbi:hypothetical protein ACFL46_00290 [Candidatus Neomarinimicrobiota bacterium]
MPRFKQLNVYRLVLVIFSIATVAACSTGVNELVEFLDRKEIIYEDISIQMGTAYWNLYSDEASAELDAPKQRYVDLFTNDTLNDLVDEWYKKRYTIKDPVTKRRVELWHNILTAAKVNYAEENLKLQSELEFWLAEDDSVEGMPSPDEMKAMVIKLMRLRNEKARTLGYDNYGELILAVSEIGSDWLEDFTETMAKRTLEPYKKLINEIKTTENKTEVNYTDVRSLLIKYYTNQITPDATGDSLITVMKMITGNIGINYDDLPVRFVENEMPPGVGGQGIAVQIPNDFRIALLPNLGLDTWMHELGHGLQAMHTTIESPILKEYEWSLGSGCGGYAEGMAEVSARFARNPEWVKRLTTMSEVEIQEKIDNANLYLTAYFRILLPTIIFEVEFYKNLDQDPDDLRRQLTQQYLLLDSPPERVRSIVDMIYVSYPLYIQNYMIAEIVSWQVHTVLEEKFGKEYVFNPEVGDFLKEYFYKDGELYPWQTRLKKATGKELDLDSYLTNLGI